MPSAQKVAIAVQKLIPFPVHLAYAVDEPIKIIPHTTSDDRCTWWLAILQHQRNYSPKNGFEYEETREAYKLKLETRDVCLRLTKDSGTLRVYGTDRLDWFKDEMLMIVLDPITARIDDCLDLQKYRKFIQKLPTGGTVADGPDFIYPLWKSQLDRWFNLGMTTYLVTPNMDAKRLSDIILLVSKHILRRSNFSVKLIAKEWSSNRKRNFQTEESIVNENEISLGDSYDATKNCALDIARDTKCIEEGVLDSAIKRIRVVSDLRFNGSFICAYKDTGAEVLVTSAEFNHAHFETPVRDTVGFHKITKHELKKDYLQSFLSSNEQ